MNVSIYIGHSICTDSLVHSRSALKWVEWKDCFHIINLDYMSINPGPALKAKSKLEMSEVKFR